MRPTIMALALCAAIPSVHAAAVLSAEQTVADSMGSVPASAQASGAVHLGSTPSSGLFMIGDFGLLQASPGLALGLSGDMYQASGPASFDTAAAVDGNAAGSMLAWLGYHVILPHALAADGPSISPAGANQTFASLGVTLGDLIVRLEETNDTITLRFSSPPLTAMLVPGVPALAGYATLRGRQPPRT